MRVIPLARLWVEHVSLPRSLATLQSLRAFLAAAQKGSADRLARSVSQVISDRLASLVHYSVSTRRQAQGDVMMVQREMEDAEGSLEIAKHVSISIDAL